MARSHHGRHRGTDEVDAASGASRHMWGLGKKDRLTEDGRELDGLAE
jgi:hypothetical protein